MITFKFNQGNCFFFGGGVLFDYFIPSIGQVINAPEIIFSTFETKKDIQYTFSNFFVSHVSFPIQGMLLKAEKKIIRASSGMGVGVMGQIFHI